MNLMPPVKQVDLVRNCETIETSEKHQHLQSKNVFLFVTPFPYFTSHVVTKIIKWNSHYFVILDKTFDHHHCHTSIEANPTVVSGRNTYSGSTFVLWLTRVQYEYNTIQHKFNTGAEDTRQQPVPNDHNFFVYSKRPTCPQSMLNSRPVP